MKRAVFLFVAVGAPLLLVAFPGLRRRIARKIRLVVLVYTGALLLLGLSTLLTDPAAPPLLAVVGLTLLAAAFLSVLWSSRKTP